MEDVIAQIPKTALDVFRMLPEGTLCEVIDNVLYMSAAPKYSHQKLVFLLSRRIADHIDETQKGIVAISPVDVYFEDFASAVQPDIMYVSNENMHILHDDGYFYGAPDLIVEVLSSDKNRDRVQKKSLYERAGVKEYFIVNPTNRNVIAYSLSEGKYRMAYQTDGFFKSAILNFEWLCCMNQKKEIRTYVVLCQATFTLTGLAVRKAMLRILQPILTSVS